MKTAETRIKRITGLHGFSSASVEISAIRATASSRSGIRLIRDSGGGELQATLPAVEKIRAIRATASSRSGIRLIRDSEGEKKGQNHGLIGFRDGTDFVASTDDRDGLKIRAIRAIRSIRDSGGGGLQATLPAIEKIRAIQPNGYKIRAIRAIRLIRDSDRKEI